MFNSFNEYKFALPFSLDLETVSNLLGYSEKELDRKLEKIIEKYYDRKFGPERQETTYTVNIERDYVKLEREVYSIDKNKIIKIEI